MISADYTFYNEVYKGDLDEALFNKHELRSEKLICFYTNTRTSYISEDSDDVDLVKDIKYCICSIVDKLVKYSAYEDKSFTSRTAGKTSESYSVSNRNKSMESDIRYEIDLYLSSHGLTCMCL